MDNSPITKQDLLEALQGFKTELKQELTPGSQMDEVMHNSMLIRIAALEKRLHNLVMHSR